MVRNLMLFLLLAGFLLSGCSPVHDVLPNEVSLSPTAGSTDSAQEDWTAVPVDPTASSTADLQPEVSPTPLEVSSTLTPEPTADTPPGIILFIGDGMGENQRLAAAWKVSGQSGSLVMDNLPVRGSAQTATADGLITDSAASATSIASGVVTNFQAIGVDQDGTAVTTILELAQASGWSVGLVSTTSLAHATPAAFASHVPERDDRAEIARQVIAHQVDVLLGGGEDDFFSADESGCFPGGGIQPSGTNLVVNALAEGYAYVCTREQLVGLDYGEIDRIMGLFAADQLSHPYSPTLVEMTEAALAVLSQDPDGFFLMIEAGQIDWAAHDNDAEQTIQLALGLDAAVAYAQIFTFERPNTLLIVTADHETGGMQVNLDGAGSSAQDGPFSMPDGTTFWVDWSTGAHTAQYIPVTAAGPYSEMLAGEYPLTRLYEVMFSYLISEGLEISD